MYFIPLTAFTGEVRNTCYRTFGILPKIKKKKVTKTVETNLGVKLIKKKAQFVTFTRVRLLVNGYPSSVKNFQTWGHCRIVVIQV